MASPAVMGRAGADIKPMADRVGNYVVGIMHDVLKQKDPKEAAIIEEAEALQAARQAMFAPEWTGVS
jgi:hypothetical protein